MSENADKYTLYSRKNWDHINDCPLPPTPEPLTEDRVREIFREEMAKWEKSLTRRVRMSSPTR